MYQVLSLRIGRVMKKYKTVLALSLSALVLTNCASRKDFIPLPENMQKAIGSTEAYLEGHHKEMGADIESSHISGAMGGGLLWALIDCGVMAYRQGRASDAMVDIQKELKAYNFQDSFNPRLEHVLRSTDWLRVNQINSVPELNPQTLTNISKRATSDVLLTSRLVYKLNPDFSVLTGTLYLTLYPMSAHLRKLAETEQPLSKPIFKMHVSATSSLPSSDKSIEERGKMWAENQGYYLKKSLDEITNQILSNLRQTLKHPNHLPES